MTPSSSGDRLASGAQDWSELARMKQQAHAEIEARYHCPHGEREIRKRQIADGRTSYVSQCIRCGHTTLPISKKTALCQNPSPPPYESHLEQRWREAKRMEYAQVYLTLKPTMAARYKAYLASDAWQLKRGEAMQRAAGRCEICEKSASDIHHLTYERIGAEEPDDLMAVCRLCHELIHGHTSASDTMRSTVRAV